MSLRRSLSAMMAPGGGFSLRRRRASSPRGEDRVHVLARCVGATEGGAVGEHEEDNDCCPSVGPDEVLHVGLRAIVIVERAPLELDGSPTQGIAREGSRRKEAIGCCDSAGLDSTDDVVRRQVQDVRSYLQIVEALT